MIKNIYAWYVSGGGFKNSDITIYAIAEDGDLLIRHKSSGAKFFEHDAGITSNFSHHKYELKYPDGRFYVQAVDPHNSRDKKFLAAYKTFIAKYGEGYHNETALHKGTFNH